MFKVANHGCAQPLWITRKKYQDSISHRGHWWGRLVSTCFPLTLNENGREKYCCHKRHPYGCYYFETFKRCKFGTYCEYLHITNKEIKRQKEIQQLKTEILHLKTIKQEPEKKIYDVSKVKFPQMLKQIKEIKLLKLF